MKRMLKILVGVVMVFTLMSMPFSSGFPLLPTQEDVSGTSRSPFLKSVTAAEFCLICFYVDGTRICICCIEF